jgi:LysR family nitrogen assimilation transcriptional regulator
MDLRQLRTFRSVAELGSLSKAADQLRIAQPALSRHIRLLEHELRTALFTRHGRGMVLTDAGKLLFERTSGLVRQLEQARDEILNAGDNPAGRVVVGMVPTIGSVLALRVAERVVRQHPGIRLRVVDAYGSFLLDWLHRGQIDMAVIYGPPGALHVDVQALRRDELYVVGARGSGLADLGAVTFEALGDRAVVLPSAPHALRLIVDQAYAAAGRPLHVAVEADSFQVLLDMAVGGLGVTFLPYYAAAAHLAAGSLEAARLDPPLTREVVLALPRDRRGSAAAMVVARIVQLEALSLAPGGCERGA